MKRSQMSKWAQTKPAWIIKISMVVNILSIPFIVIWVGTYQMWVDEGWPTICQISEALFSEIEE